MEQLKIAWNNLTKNQKIGLFAGVIVLIASVVIVCMFLIKPEAHVNLKFSAKTSIPEKELTNIKSQLILVIQDNSKNFDEHGAYDGVVRDYQENVGKKTSTASFFADFDKIRQSYKVEITWPDPGLDSPNVVISCPLADSKYPDTPCKTEVNSTSEIVGYLPYKGTLNSGKEYTVDVKYDGSGMYLNIAIDVCGGSKEANEALASAKEWITSLNKDADEFTYNLDTKTCKNKTVYAQVNHAKTNDTNVNEYLPYFVPNMYKVYPLTDDEGNVTAIKVEIKGCTDYQTDSAEQAIKDYLKAKNIQYPTQIEYCVN